MKIKRITYLCAMSPVTLAIEENKSYHGRISYKNVWPALDNAYKKKCMPLDFQVSLSFKIRNTSPGFIAA